MTFASLVLPAGWVRTDSTAGGANGTITATLATLTAGSGTQTITLLVHTASSLTTNLSNTASLSSPSDPVTSSSTDTVTPRPRADLTILKDDGSTTYTPG